MTARLRRLPLFARTFLLLLAALAVAAAALLWRLDRPIRALP